MLKQLSKDTTQYGVQVNNACIAVLYSHAPTVLTGNYVISLLIVVGLWQWIDISILLIWVGSVYILTTLRLMMVIHYIRIEKKNDIDLSKWGRYFTYSSLFSGILWGVAGSLFMLPDTPFVVAFITIVIVGMNSTAMPTLSVYGYTYDVFMVSSILPLMIRVFFVDGGIFFTLGLMIIGLIVAFLMFSRVTHKAMVNAIVLGFRNEGLIQELKKEKDRAEIARKDAEYASQAKTQFLAAASHDLRQPLHALNLFLDSLQQRLGGQQKDLVNKCRASTTALNQLLIGLLDISKLDAGVVHPEKHNFDMQNILESMRRDFTPIAKERQLRLHIRSQECIVRSDPAMVERIIRNLINNALKYTDKGGVLVASRKRRSTVTIEVWDTGIGISNENIDTIFEEFNQLDNPERDRVKGLGLGLAIVKRLCVLLDSQIHIRSIPGKGTRFWFELPLSDQQPEVFDHAAGSANPLQGASVVVIDDDSSILDAMESLLTGWGIQVITAESGAKAVLGINERQLVPDVVISDYRLRNQETGLQAIKLIHDEIDPDIPCVLLTGDTSPERIREVRQSGFALLHKPVIAMQLRTAIYQSIQQR